MHTPKRLLRARRTGTFKATSGAQLFFRKGTTFWIFFFAIFSPLRKISRTISPLTHTHGADRQSAHTLLSAFCQMKAKISLSGTFLNSSPFIFAISTQNSLTFPFSSRQKLTGSPWFPGVTGCFDSGDDPLSSSMVAQQRTHTHTDRDFARGGARKTGHFRARQTRRNPGIPVPLEGRGWPGEGATRSLPHSLPLAHKFHTHDQGRRRNRRRISRTLAQRVCFRFFFLFS